jgi:hypothetical protein
MHARDSRVLPPAPVRVSFALFLTVVVLSLFNAVIQMTLRLSGATVLVGALIETVLFVSLATQMRTGRLWARVTLMGVAWVFVAVNLIAVVGLNSSLGKHMNGLVLFTLVYLTVNLVMIIAGTVLMYRPSTRGYFH